MESSNVLPLMNPVAAEPMASVVKKSRVQPEMPRQTDFVASQPEKRKTVQSRHATQASVVAAFFPKGPAPALPHHPDTHILYRRNI